MKDKKDRSSWVEIFLLMVILLFISTCGHRPISKPGPAIASQELFAKYQVGTEDFENFKNSPEASVPVSQPLATEVVQLVPTATPSATPSPKIISAKKTTKMPPASPTPMIVERFPAISYPSEYPDKFREYDQESRKYWQKFRSNVRKNELHVFRVSFLGVKAAELFLQTHENTMFDGKEHFHFSGQVKSAEYYRFIYRIDDVIHSYVSKDNFLPAKYTLIQDETGKKISDLQLFDQSKLQTFFWLKKVKIKNNEEKRDEQVAFIPYYSQDFFSIFQFLRGMEFKKGDHYSLPIINRAKVRVLTAKIVRQEQLFVLKRKILAWKVEAETILPDVMEAKDIWEIWYSADEIKMILKISAKIKIGSVLGELERYEPGELIGI